MSKRAADAAMKAYPVEMTPLNYQDLIDQFGGKTEIDINAYPRRLFQMGYEQALKDIGIVNELIDQKGVAVVDSIDNYSGHQTINTIRFVGEDEDKPKPLPCKYYHVWLKAAKEEEQ